MPADQAEIVPPSSSSSAQIPTRPCCSLLYDELTEEHHFSVFDKCRACNNPHNVFFGLSDNGNVSIVEKLL